MKICDEKKTALRINAWYEDFEGNLEKWKDSFYTIWRYQLTWEFAYSIVLRETRKKGVYVSMLINTTYKDNVLDMMYDLGYRELMTEQEPVGFVSGYDHEELHDMEQLIIDY